ncbi:MAG: hypothetical protein IKB10_02670 [Alphaproteobacteria bacterium]|nr:hypothetical protein [Alphaproteobacteria bacterium]
MQKILKISAVSISAIVAATNANAAGYTCEELIEYTSCNPGYYLSTVDTTCPDGYMYVEDACYTPDGSGIDGDLIEDTPDDLSGFLVKPDLETCEEYGSNYNDCASIKSYCDRDNRWLGTGCFKVTSESGDEDTWDFIEKTTGQTTEPSCNECPAGSSCAGGTELNVACVAGTYQPNKKQASCISAPVGSYVADTGATTYTACTAGSYQPTVGQTSCLECPAGSYCAGTGLSVVSGQCSAGTFSFAGASECSTCPEHEYTNASGQTVSVPATTVPATGAGSVSACIIDSDKIFTDIKGTYHFKENCAYDAVLYPSCEYYDIFAQNNPSDYDCLADSEFVSICGDGDADCMKNLSYNCSLYQSAYENEECEENENGDWVCTLDLGYGIKCEY